MAYLVRVTRIPQEKTAFVRSLRLVARMSLGQAYDLALYLARFNNSVLVAGISEDLAQEIAAGLRAAGAGTEIEQCAMDTPLLCVPAAAHRYRWGKLRSIVKIA